MARLTLREVLRLVKLEEDHKPQVPLQLGASGGFADVAPSGWHHCPGFNLDKFGCC